MIEMTPEAQTRFERYLTRMRSALRGSAVEAADVEQNVREHVDVALANTAAPIGIERLDEVLEQLGPPERWLPEDEQPWWKRVASRMSSGPEDWRLAYTTFGAFAFGLFLLPVGFGLAFLICAFLLARAEHELLTSRGETLGARRWLVLPAIWTVLLGVAMLLLVAPVMALASIGLSDGNLRFVHGVPHAQPETLERVRIETGYIAMVAGGWWLVFSVLLAFLVKPLRAMFLPVTENLGRKQALLLSLIGAMVGAIGAVLLFAIP